MESGSLIDLGSKYFETIFRVNIIRTQSLYFQKENLLQSQFKVVSEVADQFFLLLISYELRVSQLTHKRSFNQT